MVQKVHPIGIGIDLGTTNSCVGVFKNGQIQIVANDEGKFTTPSEVAFTKTELLVGAAAQNKSRQNPTNTIYHVKRFMGRNYKDVEDEEKKYEFHIENSGNRPVFNVDCKGERQSFTPEQISAEILKKMKEAAEKILDAEVQDAVITVPAYFNNGQRKATKQAAILAGLNPIRIINEPTAAAMAHGFENVQNGNKTVLMYDLGGGTFDVSIVKITDGTNFEVKATGGDTHLGGADFNEELRKHCIAEIQKHFPNKNFQVNPKTLNKILSKCEKAKLDLSRSFETIVDFDGLCDTDSFSITIRRATFEHLCANLFQRTIKMVEQTLKDSKLKKTDIDDVVLVGGSTRIPKIQEMLKKFFDNKKELKQSINPDHAVAFGATAQAVALSKTTGTSFSETVLRDVTPLTLGLNTGEDNIMSVIIKRNTPIPIKTPKGKHKYQPNADYQKVVKIEVFEGERPYNKDNHRLGEFSLSGFPVDTRDKITLDVTFEIDTDGILKVSAVEEKSGMDASVVLNDGSNELSKREIENAIEDGKKHEEEDNIERERIEARKQFETFLDSMNKSINDSNVSRFTKKKIELIHRAASQWIDSNKSATRKEFEAELTKRRGEYGSI